MLVPKKLFCSPAILLDYLCDKKVTNLTWAVSALTLISSLKGLSYKVPKDVKRVMFSGEVMPVKQLRLWQEALPEAKFVNLYGPSEITCNCTYFNIGRMYPRTLCSESCVLNTNSPNFRSNSSAYTLFYA